MTDVDLVVNTFERTYRDVLAPGAFEALAAQQRHRFGCRTVLVNNVADRADAQRLADARIADGEIDRVRFVADHLEAALTRTGLTRADLHPVAYFLDWATVLVTLDGPDMVLHWDADARLREPLDWVTPALALMDRDRRVLVANPNWEVDNLAEFTSEDAGAFALGHGFSDQVFLGRRSELGRPIYGDRSLARWRYPFPTSYEARVDAHLRRHRRLRATHRAAVYVHGTDMGTSWPHQGLRDRAAAAARHGTIAALKRLPWRPAQLRQL